jgi:hypothetical protein
MSGESAMRMAMPRACANLSPPGYATPSRGMPAPVTPWNHGWDAGSGLLIGQRGGEIDWRTYG